MNFWANKLGTQPPAAAPVAPAPPANTGPWWLPQQPPVTPQVPQAQPPNGYGSETPQAPGQAAFGDLLRQENYTSTKAQSTKDNESCPNCGSANYMRSKDSPNSMKSCFDCGANPRFTQSMEGMTGAGQNIPVKTARVQQLNTNNFNPGNIIAHI